MPYDEVPLKAIIENLQKIVEEYDKDEPTTKMWRRSSTNLNNDIVHYAEWNLPGIYSSILEKYGVGDDE